MHTETVDQLVNLPWRAVILRHFEGEMRTTSKVHALIAIPYVRTELQLRSKEEKLLLMTSLRDPKICEGVAVAYAKRRDALCFVRFMLEQISVPALDTCAKMQIPFCKICSMTLNHSDELIEI